MAFAGRVLRFAEDRALGHLYNLLPDGSWEDLGRAQGELWAPRAARLHLTVTEPHALGALADADPHAFFSIDVHRVTLTAAQVAPIGRLVGLRRLFLSRIARLGDGALLPLTSLWALKALALDHTAVSDRGMASLARLGALQELDLSNTRVEGRQLGRLARLSALRRLDLSHTSVDDAGVRALGALPQLEELGVRGTRVTTEGAKVLLEGCRRLRVVGDLAENELRLGTRKTAAQA